MFSILEIFLYETVALKKLLLYLKTRIAGLDNNNKYKLMLIACIQCKYRKKEKE
jgi:hypothetical protein